MFRVSKVSKNGNNHEVKLKIPAKIIHKEAQKLIKKEEQKAYKKEQKAIRKEIAIQREYRKQAFISFLYEHQERILGVILLLISIAFIGILLSSHSALQSIKDIIMSTFGMGSYVLPILLIALSIPLISNHLAHINALRFFLLIVLYTVLLAFISLITQSDILLEGYGGSVGYALMYPLYTLFGTVITALLLIIIAYILSLIVFQYDIFKWLWNRILGLSPHIEAFSSRIKPMIIIAGERISSINSINSDMTEEPPMDNTSPIVPQKDVMREDIRPVQQDDRSIKEPVNKPIEEDTAPIIQQEKVFVEPVKMNVEILRNDISTVSADEKMLQKLSEIIVQKFLQFGIEVEMKTIYVGPTVTQFALEPSAGVKLTKITALKNDLCLALAAENVRIEAPIRGKSLVGIEIPNKQRASVGFREILESDAWRDEKSLIKLAVGRNARGEAVVADLSKMPHLLIAGKTGSGKSVAMNAFLCSLLWQNSPSTLRLILIDPKRVELKPYDKIPHLLTPVVVEPDKAASSLAWAVAEMNRRYKLLEQYGVRDLKTFNKKHPEYYEPYIVIVVDELADLMMVAGKDVEAAICRIAQMARAVGMHLLVATQRPSVDVITGLIKANLPARMSFKVSSNVDSRTVIDKGGAEELLGFGDMLYLNGNDGSLTRIQGLFIRDEEIERIVSNIKLNYESAEWVDEITDYKIEGMAKGGVLTAGLEDDYVIDKNDIDTMYEEAVNTVLQYEKASASFLQRRLEIGYARAARLLDVMEKEGIIGPVKGAKPREIYGRRGTDKSVGSDTGVGIMMREEKGSELL